MADDIAKTRRNTRELTQVGEREIREVVLSCTRARRHFQPAEYPLQLDR